MSRNVIALCGYRGSGKNTVADILERDYGYYQASFAGALKDLVSSQYGVSREYFDDRELKDSPIVDMPVLATDTFTEVVHALLERDFPTHLGRQCWSPRALCILEGSVKRSVRSDYWVRRVVEEIRQHPLRNYVVSDLRYQSEIEQLQTAFPQVVVVRVDRGLDPGTTDPSERDLDGYTTDYTIDNQGSLDTLDREIRRVVYSLRDTTYYYGPRS